VSSMLGSQEIKGNDRERRPSIKQKKIKVKTK